MPLQGIAPENSWLGSVCLKDYKNIREKKYEGNENKTILGRVNCTMDKMNRDGENKAKRYFC